METRLRVRRWDGLGTFDDGGEVAKRSNATDCKSVAPRASKVRILSSPPPARRASSGAAGAVVARAGVAQLVELQPSKLDVAGSNPVARSITEADGDETKRRESSRARRPSSSVGRARPW